MPLLWHCAANVHPPAYFLALKAWTIGFGDSPVALRSLSVVFGIAAVGAAFVLASGLGVQSHDDIAGWSAGIAASILVACAPLLIELSQTARMYSLGVFLAGITSWLLVKSVTAESNSFRCWLAYGVALGLLCYVHNYAFFAVAGQAMFAFGFFWQQASRESGRSAVKNAVGLWMAASVAAALYSPWLPAFIAQAKQVSLGYWIDEPTTRDVLGLVSRWFWGHDGGATGAVLGLAIVTFAAAIVIRCRDVIGYCLLAQVIIPWCLSLTISWGGPTSILQERYFCFAQFMLFCLVGRAVFLGIGFSIAWIALVCWTAIVIAFACAPRANWNARDYDDFSDSVAYLAGDYCPGDVVVVGRPGELNLVRYYLEQSGISKADVRCPVESLRRAGHEVHLGSISGDDVLWSGEPPRSVLRCWIVFDGKRPHVAPTQPGMIETTRYSGSPSSRWCVVLMIRPPIPETTR
jgi:uncharacterized membrane protein